MSDTITAPDVNSQIAELQKQIAGLLQTQGANQGGTYPHAAILAGQPAHTVLGPCDANGKVLPGAWNTVTGLWEDPDTAARNSAAAAAAQADQVAAAKAQAQAELVAKALAIAKKELADEADLAALVAEQKAAISGASTPAARPSAF